MYILLHSTWQIFVCVWRMGKRRKQKVSLIDPRIEVAVLQKHGLSHRQLFLTAQKRRSKTLMLSCLDLEVYIVQLLPHFSPMAPRMRLRNQTQHLSTSSGMRMKLLVRQVLKNCLNSLPSSNSICHDH